MVSKNLFKTRSYPKILLWIYSEPEVLSKNCSEFVQEPEVAWKLLLCFLKSEMVSKNSFNFFLNRKWPAKIVLNFSEPEVAWKNFSHSFSDRKCSLKISLIIFCVWNGHKSRISLLLWKSLSSHFYKVSKIKMQTEHWTISSI